MNLMRMLFLLSLSPSLSCSRPMNTLSRTPTKRGHCTICINISLQTMQKNFWYFKMSISLSFFLLLSFPHLCRCYSECLFTFVANHSLSLFHNAECPVCSLFLTHLLALALFVRFLRFTFLFINGIIKCMDVASIMER